MAEVHEAWDAILGRRVAVKLLDERGASDPPLVARFLREAQASAWLAHPNVVAVHDAGRDRGVPFVVMELVEGSSVADLLRDGPLPPERAAAIVSDACLAIEHAHRNAVFHRNLKPSNILLTADGEAKVADFATAGATGQPSATERGIPDNPEYLAPEQAAGGVVDGRADLYALGCCLYEMLTGKPPFGRVGDPGGDGPDVAALTPLTIALRHIRDTPVPPHRRRPGVPAALDRVVMRALAKQPDSRQQSAEELRRELDRFRRRPPAPVTPVAPQALPGDEAKPDPARRRRAAAVAAVRAAGAFTPAGIRPAGGEPGAAAAVVAVGPEGATAPIGPRVRAGAGAGTAPAAPAGTRTGPLRGGHEPARRRLAALIGLAALTLLAAGGTIAALAPPEQRQPDRAAAVLPPPSVEPTPAPTTAQETTTTTAATTTTVPRTSRTTTTRPATTSTRPVGNPLVTVPDVVGREIGDAAAELSRRRLGTRVEAVPTRRRSQLGEVVRQEPAPGTRVAQGTAVTVVVAMWLDRGSRD
jgi:serine/threonine-protein kinase